MPEIVIILVIALLIFGPTRLPGLGKSMGEAIRGFKKGIDGAGDRDVTDENPREADRLESVKSEEIKKTKVKEEDQA
tara:strand:+ start:307 stop:537 length:231 start_codon:yes stop_codon:yes gene_type:complete